jgi:hypothetical protein
MRVEPGDLTAVAPAPGVGTEAVALVSPISADAGQGACLVGSGLARRPSCRGPEPQLVLSGCRQHSTSPRNDFELALKALA